MLSLYCQRQQDIVHASNLVDCNGTHTLVHTVVFACHQSIRSRNKVVDIAPSTILRLVKGRLGTVCLTQDLHGLQQFLNFIRIRLSRAHIHDFIVFQHQNLTQQTLIICLGPQGKIGRILLVGSHGFHGHKAGYGLAVPIGSQQRHPGGNLVNTPVFLCIRL